MNEVQTAPSGGCPPPIVLEAFFAGERVGPADSAHFGGCEACRSKLGALTAGSEAFLLHHPPAALRARFAQRRPALRWPRWAPLALVPVAALALLFVRPDDSVRLKGARFHVLLHRAGKSHPLGAFERVHAGDSIRFLFQPPQDGYLMILDLDGRDRPEAFYPYGSAQAAAVNASAGPLLPGTIALDGAPGPEHLIAIFRRAPFTLAWATAALRPGTAGTAPSLSCADCLVETVRLAKEP